MTTSGWHPPGRVRFFRGLVRAAVEEFYTSCRTWGYHEWMDMMLAITYVKKRATGGHAAGASGHASAGATVAPKPRVTAVEFFAHIDR